jgi:hypothetical protein
MLLCLSSLDALKACGPMDFDGWVAERLWFVFWSSSSAFSLGGITQIETCGGSHQIWREGQTIFARCHSSQKIKK